MLDVSLRFFLTVLPKKKELKSFYIAYKNSTCYKRTELFARRLVLQKTDETYTIVARDRQGGKKIDKGHKKQGDEIAKLLDNGSLE